MNQTLFNQLKNLRQTLHKYPEVSGNEFETKQRVLEFCNGLSPSEIIPLGKTGLAVIFNSNEPGETVLIRGDMDALPIREINTFEHASVFEAVSHKCGHDGHTAVLCGLASHLAEQPVKTGKVVLLFQPAEENGKGAQEIIDDDRFYENEPDWVFAFHNLPGYPLHQTVVREGAFTASAKSIIIKLDGKTSHAAEPELGYNPAQAIAEVIQYGMDIAVTAIDSDGFFLVTPVYLNMGEKAYGISAGHGEVHLTLRSFSNGVMDAQSSRIAAEAKAIAEKYHLKATIQWTEVFAANENNAEAVELIKQSAKQENGLAVRAQPFKWGEDFGLFTQRYKGAMFGIGSGENCPALHNPDYDFPDEIIPTAVEIFETITRKILS